jgi:hypothetical protein
MDGDASSTILSLNYCSLLHTFSLLTRDATISTSSAYHTPYYLSAGDEVPHDSHVDVYVSLLGDSSKQSRVPSSLCEYDFYRHGGNLNGRFLTAWRSRCTAVTVVASAHSNWRPSHCSTFHFSSILLSQQLFSLFTSISFSLYSSVPKFPLGVCSSVAYLFTSHSRRHHLNYRRISHSILSISRGLGPA